MDGMVECNLTNIYFVLYNSQNRINSNLLDTVTYDPAILNHDLKIQQGDTKANTALPRRLLPQNKTRTWHAQTGKIITLPFTSN
jgi:hypothetical protein